jgi:hypothetical protein
VKAFVVTRDRVSYARQCVDALLAPGLRLDVIIVDHGSTWPPMTDWLDTLAAYDHPRVAVWRDENRHPRDLWRLGGPLHRAPLSADERFIVTDCDVIPDPACPADWPARMAATLDRYPAIRKVGLGLRTDDLPEHFQHADMVRTWEAQYQAVADGGRLSTMTTDHDAVIADVDTTLAMYRHFETFTLGPSIRLRPPYVARHLPWYEDTLHLDIEQQYYRDHAVHGHWRSPTTYADDYGLRG